jgi:hypothetical protein
MVSLTAHRATGMRKCQERAFPALPLQTVAAEWTLTGYIQVSTSQEGALGREARAALRRCSAVISGTLHQ